MATWTRFYINDSLDRVNLKLVEITKFQETNQGKFTDNFHKYYLLDEKFNPNYLVYGEQNNGWITVIHNSFSHLNEWAEKISKDLNCTLVVTIAQSTVDYYYFCHYNSGIKIREILRCYGDDITPINYGEPYPIEDIEPSYKIDSEEEANYFDFDNIEVNCKYLGFEIQSENFEEVNWTILKGKFKQESIDDFINKLNKPWWKFW